MLIVHKQTNLNQSNGIVALGKGESFQLKKDSDQRYFTCNSGKLQLQDFQRNSAKNIAKEKFVLLFESNIQVGNMTFPVKYLFLCGINEKYSII